MTYNDVMATLEAKREKLVALHGELQALQARIEPQELQDYVLTGWSGPVRLSELFGDKPDLILIHNMGAAAPAAPCGPTASTASTTTSPRAPRSSSPARTRSRCRSGSPPAAAGASR